MPFQYLNIELMEKMCHQLAVTLFDKKDDPIPPFNKHTRSLLESALNLPRQTFDGKDLYPSLADKAAALYYSLNKNHPFFNGNKRMATASLLIFLFINNNWLDADIAEMVEKAIEVADSKPSERDELLIKLKKWIAGRLTKA